MSHFFRRSYLTDVSVLAKIVHRLQREFKAFDQARRAQIAAYDSGRLIWQDIQESQRLLWAAGRDPVEVLKGLQDDEDFKMTADQVKALSEVLGWPIASSLAPVVTDNLCLPPIEDETEESAPLQSTVRDSSFISSNLCFLSFLLGTPAFIT